jgi:Subtilase family
VVEAKTANFTDLAAGVDRAAALGAKAISNSYGGPEFSQETSATYGSHYNHPGIAITVSSGDEGYGPEFPAASGYVTAVGGTTLSRAANARGWSETAWSGAGSGCSAYVAKPSWQTDTGCARRTIADVSAVADPNTGVSVYDSTRCAYPYSHRSGLNDVLSGANGTCSPAYLCTAGSGFDGPTGLGTPIGTSAF